MEFLDLLQRHYPERVLKTMLFGSKARGDSRQWSDIDILIVVDQDDWRLSHAISNLAADISLKYDVLIGPRVIGEKRWERMKKVPLCSLPEHRCRWDSLDTRFVAAILSHSPSFFTWSQHGARSRCRVELQSEKG